MNAIISAVTRHPVMANLLMIAILIGGAIGFSGMIREMVPIYSANRIQIRIPYPGASPAEVEEGIVLKVEEAIQGLEGIKNIDSFCREGLGIVVAEVEEKYDENLALADIRNAVESIVGFPNDAEKPVISKLLLVNPAMMLLVTGQVSERVLRELAMEIRNELLATPGITQVEVDGVRDYEIAIRVSEEKLRKYELTLERIAALVAGGSIDLPAGSIHTLHEEYKLEIKGRKREGERYRELPILTRPDGTVVRLGQIAEIEDSFVEDEYAGRFNGQPGCMIRIMRTSQQDSMQIAQIVKKYVGAKSIELPKELQLKIFADFSVMIQGRIDLLLKNGFWGLLWVFLALLIFLNLRLSIWVALGIPVSFAFAGIVMYVTGQSLNMINMFGMILVLGIVVDDAIVIGENIFQHQKREKDLMQAAIQGTQQMVWPVIGTVTTTIVAFLPLFFVSGVMGKFILEIPIAVVSVLCGSLIESLLILPNHLGHQPKLFELVGKWSTAVWHFFMGWLISLPRLLQLMRGTLEFLIEWTIAYVYRPLFSLALTYRFATLTLAFTTLLLCLGMVQGGLVPFSFFPEADSEYLAGELVFPEGTTITRTQEAVARAEAALLSINDTHGHLGDAEGKVVKYVYSEVGNREGASHKGMLQAVLVGPELRNIHSDRVLDIWRERVGTVADIVTMKFSPREGPAPQGHAIEIYALGKNLSELAAAGAALAEKLGSFEGTYEAQSDFQEGKRELQIRLTHDGHSLGLTLQSLAQQVRQGFYGAEALRLQRGRDEVKVQIRYPLRERQTLYDLDKLQIRLDNGLSVPFAQVASVEFSRSISEIKRRNGSRRIGITAEVQKGVTTADDVLSELQKTYLVEFQRGFPDVTLAFEGPKAESARSLASMKSGYALALIGIFLVLALLFRSYLQPLLIMTTIPLGIVGAILGHYFMGYTFNMMSMFGVVALTGVVINDALVMIDRINVRQREGLNVFASVLDAAPGRFRAIMLTTLTTFAGLSPLLAERSFQAQFLIPMAISLSFGLVFATFLTLFLIPALYLILGDLRRIVYWLIHSRWPSREEVEPAYHQGIKLRNERSDAIASEENRVVETRLFEN